MHPSTRSIAKPPTSSPRPVTGISAPYGHACANCAKAKCKCIHRDVGGSCERCFRLKKECIPAVPNRKRNPRKAPGSRTAHLEEKLDDLVSLIRSQTAIRAPEGKVLEEHGISRGHFSAGRSSSSVSSPNASPTGPASGELHTTDATSPSSTSLGPECDYPISNEVAEASLALFRRDMVRFFPLVYLPPAMSAAELRRTRPFLWLSIMACANRSMRETHAIGDRMKQVIANKTVLELERSIDLIHGLLVSLQWPHCHRNDKSWLSLWTNLVITMAQDLGFTSLKVETAFTYLKKFWMPKHIFKPQLSPARTTEECRTILASYIWTSSHSQMVRRENALRWTPFMEQCLRALMERPECEGDSVLATQVRCSLLSQQITDLSLQQAVRGEIRIPMYFHISLSTQLEEIWRTLPTSLVHNETALLHLYATEVAIHELASSFDPSTTNADIMKRLEAFQKCLKAVESFFQIWDRITPAQHIGFTFISFIQLLHVIVALFRLSTLDNIPGWDTAEARNRLHLFALLDHIAERFDTSTSAIPILEDDPDEEGSVWSKAAKVMRLIKQGIARDYPIFNPLGGIGPVPTMCENGTDIQEPPQQAQDAFMTSFGDDPWLSAIFVPWDSMNF